MRTLMKTLPGMGYLSAKLIRLTRLILANLTAQFHFPLIKTFIRQKSSKDSESVKAFSEEKLVVSSFQE